MRFKKIFSLFALVPALLFGACAGGGGGQENHRPGGGEEELPPAQTQRENAVQAYWKEATAFGITVSNEGRMDLGGRPLYCAGVNCFNLFNRCLSDDYRADGAYRTLDALKSNGVRIVRFDCGGYDYRFLSEYFERKEEYLELLKKIASYAQEKEIGLIPSFFWLNSAVPDYYDEPLRSWGRENSRTVGFLEEYTVTIVNALKDHRSLFAWEFGNEFNLACDLPNVTEHLPPLPPHSTRASRNEEDYLSATDVSFAFGRFASLVRANDPHGRMITSGNASLRPSQYHQLHENSWTQDSEEQYAAMCNMFCPGEMDAVCEHIYFTEQKTFGRDLRLSEYLEILLSMAKDMKKAFWVGEWGGGVSEDYKYYSNIAHTFVDAGVQLTLLWNFNLVEGETEYSFSAESERGKMLLRVVNEMNERLENEFYDN